MFLFMLISSLFLIISLSDSVEAKTIAPVDVHISHNSYAQYTQSNNGQAMKTMAVNTAVVRTKTTKNATIAIDIGHNVPYDVGADGIIKENTINMEVGQRVINKLQSRGYNVISTKPSTAASVRDSLHKRVDAANNSNAQLFVSIHANNGSGKGTEVWSGGSKKSAELASNILNNMTSLGYDNRGVKVQGRDGKSLYVLNNTSMPAVLVETCFVDSKSDINRYNPDSISDAIVEGIINSLD